LPKEGTCENMIYTFCFALLNSSNFSIEAIDLLKRQAFGYVKKVGLDFANNGATI